MTLGRTNKSVLNPHNHNCVWLAAAVGVLGAVAGVLAIVTLSVDDSGRKPSELAVGPRLGSSVSGVASATRADWFALSRRLAAPWPGMQLRSGSMPDHLREGDPGTYGDGAIGLALLQTGTRDRNSGLVRAGLRAVSSETRSLRIHYNTHPFRVWAVAAAYDIARRRLGHWRAAGVAMRRWALWLRQQPSIWLWEPPYQNKVLVAALAVLEAQRTGLRSPVYGSVLGSAARARAVRLVNQTIPSMAAGSSAYVLSDPDQNPIAYHALSHAIYARAVRLLGRDASWRARRALGRLARATWLSMAPDGSVAYWGRSQGQSWALSAAAYGLALTARERGSVAGSDRKYYALAGRALRRLRAYGVGPRGGHIIPALGNDPRGGARALDDYANAPEYAGLTLIFLNWAIPLLPPGQTGGEIAADRPLAAVLNGGSGRFATVRRARVWFSAREQAGNLRYDFGPIAAQRLERDGWRDVIPYRPKGGGYDSAGPVLLSPSGRGLPVGDATRVSRDGRVLVRGGFRRRGWLRKGAKFLIQPTSCGVEVAVRGRAGDRYEFSAFFRGSARPAIGERRARSGGEVAAFNLPIRSSSITRGYHSASDPWLTRGRFVLEARREQWVSMELC